MTQAVAGDARRAISRDTGRRGRNQLQQSSRTKVPTLLTLGVAWLLIVDSLTRVSAGPLSLSGALTLATALLCAFLSPIIILGRTSQKSGSGRATIPWPLTAFVVVALIALAMEPSAEGLQNVAVYTIFVASAGLTSVQVSRAGAQAIGHRMRLVGLIVTCAFIVTNLAGFRLFSERAFGLVGLIFLAVLIPNTPRRKIVRLAPFLVAGAIALSLSRTATVIAIAMLMFLALRARKGLKLLASLGMAVAAGGLAYWLFNFYEPFRERFLEGDGGATVGGVELNTSGRAVLWDITYKSSQEAPVFGHGPGSASALITPLFRNIGHPHNEYLRILHDFGWVGLVLFGLGMVMLLTRIAARIRRSGDPIHWSALLSLVAVLSAAITDNVIVYPFIMLPLGLIIGASLGLPLEPESEPEPSHGVGSPRIEDARRNTISGTPRARN
ncbi:O-antigen ligase family protein [Arthrobacter sp. Rue61a]|uniref:O-antigen ligase family protein n=1 Tax=Arthrobacter sp. Rue61a TaxID=1118963 RepID=UPI00027DF3F4|nr:O-antigen ligase family protein [Arthrobacter sp. Rue61a]AFR30185.1 O-antigen polymerase [Arthrobacter sp. Rue61a]